MKLYVMRHGIAEDHASSGRDEDRALTGSGRDGVRDVARLLLREGEMPLRILASPLVRANQTAEIVAAAVKAGGGSGAIETVRDLRPGGHALRVVERLKASATDGALIVGHEPDLSGLVHTLLGEVFVLAMEKAMVVALSLDDAPEAALRFVVDPRAVAVVHDRRHS